MSWRATSGNTPDTGLSSATCASAPSRAPTTWRCTWRDTCDACADPADGTINLFFIFVFKNVLSWIKKCNKWQVSSTWCWRELVLLRHHVWHVCTGVDAKMTARSQCFVAELLFGQCEGAPHGQNTRKKSSRRQGFVAKLLSMQRHGAPHRDRNHFLV